MPLVRRTLLALALAGALATPARATDLAALDESAVRELVACRERIATLEDLRARGKLAPELAREEAARHLARASELLGGAPVTSTSLVTIEADVARAHGWSRVVSVVWVVAGLLVAGCGAVLFATYVLPWLLRLPVAVREVAVHATSLALLGGAAWLSPEVRIPVAFVGCLGTLAATTWSCARRRVESPAAPAVALCLLWGAAAAFYLSPLLATLSVLAYMTAFGFSVLVGPLCWCVGFTRRERIPGAMAAALVLVVGFLALGKSLGASPHVAVFATASLVTGSLVWGIGALVVSSRWYGRRDRARYAVLQVLAAGSLLGAVAAGALLEAPIVERTGATFLGLWVTEKWIELPWSKKTVAWCGLGLGAILWGLAWLASRHPEKVLGWW